MSVPKLTTLTLCKCGGSSVQGGVSGNKAVGCDAIVVSGARSDGLGEDRFDRLVYAAKTNQGALAMLTSMAQRKPIRVFRSSADEQNPYKALHRPREEPTQYRFDGNYTPISVGYIGQNGKPCRETCGNLSPPLTGRIYQFQLERVEVGEDRHMNRMSSLKLMRDSVAKSTMASEALAAFSEHKRLDRPS